MMHRLVPKPLKTAPTKVASVWFAVSERTLANACMSLGGLIGTALVVRYAPALVQGDPSRIPLLNLTVLVLSLTSSLCAFSIRDKPKSPPSASAGESNMPFLQGLKSILKNRNFIILLFVFGFYVGTFNVYITLISDYVVANGYSEVITICQAIRT